MALKKLSLALMALAIPAGIAFAQDPAPAADAAAKPEKVKVMQICKSDLASLCADAKDKQGRAACLRTNEAKLSPDCAKAVASKPAKWGTKGAAADTSSPE